MDELERVQKIIANSGYCARRKAEELIEQGRVQVNDKPIKLGDKAKSFDRITIDGKPIHSERKVYIMLNKPFGYVTTTEDPHEERIITKLIDIPQRIYPVGRLDKFTGGLIILTNDGDFANRIMHPRYEIEKTYYVKTERSISNEEIMMLRKGIMIEDRMTSEAKVKRLSLTEIELTIHEGRNRIVRKMMESFEHMVKVLIRIQIGRLKLGHLKPGQYYQMTDEEKELVFAGKQEDRSTPQRRLSSRKEQPRQRSSTSRSPRTTIARRRFKS
ncbi:rRNA pseudouridine synthase [Candidatus Woesearchaeota archaeon]|nr:rRNA pseudouridine synthase [Candidatus Woesearchaeota archaeon]